MYAFITETDLILKMDRGITNQTDQAQEGSTKLILQVGQAEERSNDQLRLKIKHVIGFN